LCLPNIPRPGVNPAQEVDEDDELDLEIWDEERQKIAKIKLMEQNLNAS